MAFAFTAVIVGIVVATAFLAYLGAFALYYSARAGWRVIKRLSSRASPS
jgi:hypothetical protein